MHISFDHIQKYKRMKLTITYIKYIAISIMFFGLSTQQVRAQNHIQLSYDFSVATGDTRDYIGKSSPRGGSFEFRHHVNKNIALGLKVGLQTFYEALEKDTYTEDNITYYGKQFRYLNSSPVLATFQYNLTGNETGSRSYVKLGAGAYYFEKRTDLGLYTFTNDYQWNFGLQPELGIIFPMNNTFAINVNARYNYILRNQSLDNQQYFSLGVGIMILNLGRRY